MKQRIFKSGNKKALSHLSQRLPLVQKGELIMKFGESNIVFMTKFSGSLTFERALDPVKILSPFQPNSNKIPYFPLISEVECGKHAQFVNLRPSCSKSVTFQLIPKLLKIVLFCDICFSIKGHCPVTNNDSHI